MNTSTLKSWRKLLVLLLGLPLAAFASDQNGNSHAGSSTASKQAAVAANSAVAGTWYAIANTFGSPIELKTNGTYLFGGQAGGRYTVTANGIDFTGTLASWNNGHSTLKNGVIEFYWTNSSGAKNYFAYSR